MWPIVNFVRIDSCATGHNNDTYVISGLPGFHESDHEPNNTASMAFCLRDLSESAEGVAAVLPSAVPPAAVPPPSVPPAVSLLTHGTGSADKLLPGTVATAAEAADADESSLQGGPGKST